MLVKIAACLIVKGTDDEADHLARCLTNIAPHVDGIFLNINAKPGHKPSSKIMRVARKFTNNVITTEWHDDFAEARNINIAQVPEDYTHILWLDTDDTIDHPEKIRDVVEAAGTTDAVFVDYLYDQDEAGNPLTVHMVARIFRHNGSQTWKGIIHETLVDTRTSSRVATKDIVVVHHAGEKRKDKSLERNIRLLKKKLDSEGENPDPRTLYYLGCSYMDAGDFASARYLLETYLSISGWDEERSAAETKLGRMFLEEGDRWQAKQHFMLAIGEAPNNPEPQVETGSLELEIKQYHKARKWLEGVLQLQVDIGTLERNPMSYTFRTHLLLADVYVGLGGSYLDKALESVRKAASYKPDSKDINAYVSLIENVVEDKHLTENILTLIRKLKKNKEDEKIEGLLASVPKQLEDNPLIMHMRDDKPFTWPEKTVVIMCGDTPIPEWGPWSLEQGIGGSEEAIIRLSKHLNDLGYKVVVYANPSAKAGLYDGVMWRNFWEANLDDTFDIFIAWRAPYIFDRKIKARKNYLWLHDVMPAGDFTPERLNNLDKVMVLSKYHRSLFPLIPDEKIMLTANAIDPEDFEAMDAEGIQRDPHKIFYGSSHVRGLTYLYEIWPEVKKAVPDATLDVYYGRESYDLINAGNPERLRWMDEVQRKAKELNGVTDHGKVGQKDIMRHMYESGVWAYPCPFPETYCITAVKAQAAGCIPVASNYAALDETIQYGHKQAFGEFDAADLEKYKSKLIWWLEHPEAQEELRPQMMQWARSVSWLKVAQEWHDEFSR